MIGSLLCKLLGVTYLFIVNFLDLLISNDATIYEKIVDRL